MKMVDEENNLGATSADRVTEQGQVSDEIERDTARGLWNRPNPDDGEDEDGY